MKIESVDNNYRIVLESGNSIVIKRYELVNIFEAFGVCEPNKRGVYVDKIGNLFIRYSDDCDCFIDWEAVIFTDDGSVSTSELTWSEVQERMVFPIQYISQRHRIA